MHARTLEVLRDPTITLTNKQVIEKPALEWFKEGKLGMVAGFRDLTPELRATPGLDFDIMPMPELDDDATIGDLTGVCVAEGPQERVEQSADFLVDLLSDEQEPEILSVVAHELGHARHDDVLVGSALGAAGALAAVGLLGLLVGGVGEPRRVPRVLALVAVATLLASPLENAISRRIETRADVDALRTTGDPAAFVELQKELARRSLADPTPPAWSQLWFGSHPTVLQRIALAEP